MQEFEISKEIKIEMGHRLPNHNGRCSNIHGHSYLIELVVDATALRTTGATEGMVEDFSVLKQALDPIDAIFDHAMVLSVDDMMLLSLMEGSLAEKQEYIKHIKELNDVFTTFSGVMATRLVVIRQPPTAEILGMVWLHIIRRTFNELKGKGSVKLTKLIVRETATSRAIINASNNTSDQLLSFKDWRRPS